MLSIVVRALFVDPTRMLFKPSAVKNWVPFFAGAHVPIIIGVGTYWLYILLPIAMFFFGYWLHFFVDYVQVYRTFEDVASKMYRTEGFIALDTDKEILENMLRDIIEDCDVAIEATVQQDGSDCIVTLSGIVPTIGKEMCRKGLEEFGIKTREL